jgi:hypothetical protein
MVAGERSCNTGISYIHVGQKWWLVIALTDMDVGNARVVGNIHGPNNTTIPYIHVGKKRRSSFQPERGPSKAFSSIDPNPPTRHHPLIASNNIRRDYGL